MKKYLPYIIIVLVAGAVIYSGFSKENGIPSNDDQQTAQSLGSTQWETKTNNEASVTVSVTPLDFGDQSQEWQIHITMDTHSVELDQDMIAVSTLTDDSGNEYKPLRWDGPVGGHHLEGVLIFDPITPLPQSLELQIIGIGEVERSFIWQFK